MCKSAKYSNRVPEKSNDLSEFLELLSRMVDDTGDSFVTEMSFGNGHTWFVHRQPSNLSSYSAKPITHETMTSKASYYAESRLVPLWFQVSESLPEEDQRRYKGIIEEAYRAILQDINRKSK